jgi:hypothetical protein
MLLAAGIVVAGIALAISTLAMGWDQGFVTRAAMPRYSRVRLPEPAMVPAHIDAQADAIVQAIAESAQEAPPAIGPATGPVALPATAANAPAPLAGLRPAPPPGKHPAPFIPLEFDIATPGAGGESVGGDAIVVRKPVRMGAQELGTLPVHVDGDSRLLVDAGDVLDLLARAGASATFKGSGLISFGELRNSGVDLRYDPNSDSVLLATR